MNIFQYYIYIFDTPFHMISILLVGLALLIGILIQKQHTFHIRVVISMLMCIFGHFVYEDIFIVIMGLTGRGTSMIYLYLAVTFLLGMIIMFVHIGYPFLRFNPSFIVSLAGLLFCFGVLWLSGWFYMLQLWYVGEGPPVENWLWAVTKFLGFLTWVKLIDKRRNE